MVAVGFAALVLVLAASLLAYGVTQGNRIYPGVRIGSVDVGGLDTAEAESRVRARLTQFAEQSLTLRFEGHEARLRVGDLDPVWDIEAAVTDAQRVGRSGSLWRDSGTWLRARLFGERVAIPVTFDASPVEKALTEIATLAATPPVEPRFDVDENGAVRVVPGRSGLGIDLGVALAEVERRLMLAESGTIDLAPVTLQPNIRDDELEALVPQVEELVGEPITLSLDGEPRWMIEPRDLLSLLIVQRTADGYSVRLDRGKLEAYLGRIADFVVTPSRDATVQWDGLHFVVIPAQPGAVLDVEGTVAELLERVARHQRTVPVRARRADPLVTTPMAQAAKTAAEQLVNRGILVRWPGGERWLKGDDLAALLAFEPQRVGEQVTGLRVTLDPERAGAFLRDLESEVRQEPRDAVLRYSGGQVRVVAAEQVGQELDLEASLEALQRAVEAGTREVPLAVREVKPKITSAMAAEIVIRERISSGATYYGDSAPNRRHNVELAVERVDGALVPPGEVFSFNQTVGPINLENGYKVGYGIVTTNGRVQTVPSVGGGVCQVSTTLFHAAFWGGFPIVERNWHLYWIPLYGQPPSGLIGLDATVDTDFGLDFRFRNATNDWIAIVAWADGSWVHFEIWGTKPNWRVEVDDPVVTDVVKADPTPVFRESPDLAPGEQVIVERARDGFTVTIRRRVYEGDRLIDDLTLRSTYLPSQNVTLVGPQPSPRPTASPTPEPMVGTPAAEESNAPEAEPTATPTQE
ncbi:VanW family protein [Thermomicrobium sp. 4228-Ro]|uniref:VanW family protein n=1 Tax=Thermomicrobium sp. 4228-Ro TaxID=2993937 RepID=UPI002248B64B|nr:peptidoglycan binding domain-containing protein [Thermomicrobium sp. 4228-Ro]MCX2726052.1 VanW family protein [Thermomicrobium sp. 4228-Ro]